MSIEEIIINFEKYLESRALSSASIKGYVNDSHLFLCYLNKIKISAEQFDKSHIILYFKDRCYLQLQTQLRILASLNHLSDFLILQGIRESNPILMYQKPKASGKLPSYLNETEIKKLLDAPNTLTPIGLRDKAILEILYASGLRVSELCALKFEDWFEEKGYFIIKGKGSKERVVLLSNRAKNALNLYLQKRSEINSSVAVFSNYIFISPYASSGDHLSRHSVLRIVKKYCKKIKCNKVVSPHILRHSFATSLLNHGMNVRTLQILLGHESLSTTMIYTHVTDLTLSSVFSKVRKKF